MAIDDKLLKNKINLAQVDEEPVEEEQPEVPPPVEPPEYYEGYKAELTQYAKEATEKEKSRTTTVQERKTDTSLIPSFLASYRAGATAESLQSTKDQMAKIQAQADQFKQQTLATVNTQSSSEWRYSVLNTLPTLMLINGYKGKGINGVEDIMILFNKTDMTPEDTQWITDTYKKLEYLKPKLPEGYDPNEPMETVKKKLLESIQVEQKLPLRAVSTMTVDELAKYFVKPEAAMPEGLTAEEFRSVISYMDLPVEDQTSIDEFILSNMTAWRVESQRLALIKDGLEVQAPEKTSADVLKAMLVAPFAGTIALLDKIWNLTVRPAVAGGVLATRAGLKTLGLAAVDTDAAKLENLYDNYKAEGESTWAALSLAYNDWNMPEWYKFIAETSFDPTSYLGLGIYSKVADIGGVVLLKTIGKGELLTIPRLGSRTMSTKIGAAVESFEQGYNRAADALFRAGKEVVLAPIKGAFWTAGKLGAKTGYEIPRTLTQMARNYARGAMSAFFSAALRRNPAVRGVDQLTLHDIDDTLDFVLKQAIERPREGADFNVFAGGSILEPEYLDVDKAKKLLEAIADDFQWDTPALARLNDNILEMLNSGLGERVTAGNIIAKLGKVATDESVDKLSTKLSNLKKIMVQEAKARSVGKTVKDRVISLFDNTERVRLMNLQNPISTHLTQAGRSTSWVSRIADKTLQSVHLVNFERKVVQPFARWQLLFMNFGPANFFENMQRSFLGGTELIVPNDYMGLWEFELKAGDLMNFPWEASVLGRQHKRLEQAVVDPKVGTTSVYRGGNIPLVTKPLRDKEGNVISKHINIRGEDYAISDLQSYNDMWEDMTGLQRYRDIEVHFDKQLYAVAPEEMKQIDDILFKHQNKLKSIASFEKEDIPGIVRVGRSGAVRGPEQYRALADVTAPIMTRRKINKDLAKTIKDATEISGRVKKGITDSILDGSAFKDLAASRKATKGAVMDESIVALTPQIDRLKDIAKTFATDPPKTVADFAADMNNVSAIIGSVKDRIHEYRKITELRAQQLAPNPGEVDKFHEGSTKVLAEFLEVSGKTLEDLITQMEKNSRLLDSKGANILNASQISAVDELNEVYRLEFAQSLATRTKLNSIYSVIPKTAKGSRNERFWNQIRSKVSEVWDIDEQARRRFQNMELTSKRRFVNAIGQPAYVPDNVPPVTGKLTVNHLAYLFGCTGDDVNRGLTMVTDHIVIRPKEDFIAFTLNQADAYAEKLKTTSTALGFTEEAIGTLYDDMWKQLGIDPMTLQINSPAMKNVDNIYDEMQRLYDTVKVPESDVLKYKEYINAVADDLEQTSMYKTATPEALAGYKIEEVDVTGTTGTQFYPGYKGTEVKVIGPEGGEASYIRYFTKDNELIIDDIVSTRATPPGKMSAALGQIVSKNYGKDILTTPLTGKGLRFLQALERKGYIKLSTPSVEYLQRMKTAFEKIKMNLKEPVKVDIVNMPKDSSITGLDSWYNTKEQAMIQAKEQHALSYPTYDDNNIIDEAMKAIFPFWNYEVFRYRWLPRTFLRTPGTLTGLARYMDYTDGGYIPVPFTDMQINPLRGSIWMGGLRSMYLKDFPEYYDQFPGLEFFESLGRLGFYPGLPIQLPMVIYGAANQVPEWSELAPPWVNTPLSALRQLSPQYLGAIIDKVYPDRFRDYQTMLTLGKWGYDADAIWKKMKTGQSLTSDEQKLWLKAEADANGFRQIVMEQIGMLRYRPEEYDTYKENFKKAIEEITGVSVAIQEEIDKQYPITGKRFSDYYPLDVYQQKLLYSYDTFRQWQGVGASLYPSSWGQMELKISQYYEEVEKLQQNIRHTGLKDEEGNLISYSIEDLNNQLIAGKISPKQWVNGRSELVGKLADRIETLSNSDYYKDIPKSLDEREAYMKEKGAIVPTLLPDQELLYYYYDLQPQMKYNPETGLQELDFDTYYAYVDNLLNSMEQPYRERLVARIQSNWTGLEKLYWNVSREYIKPYNMVRDVVLSKYDTDAQYWINKFNRGDTEAKQKIQSYTMPDGSSLISNFNSELSKAHEAMRQADPDLDAWLNFFGKVQSFKTTEAEEKYQELKAKYLTPEMVK